MPAAIGLKARTGRAILIALGGDPREPLVLERSQMPLLPEGAFAPYHAAEGLTPAKAERSVKRDIEAAHGLAAEGIREAVKRLSKAGHEVAGCGVLVGPPLPDWTTQDVLAVHVRMHQAEGVLFREVLVSATRACKTALTAIPEKTALDAAARMLGIPRERLDARLAALGKAAGPPWGKDQKEAAAAALVVLERAHARQPA